MARPIQATPPLTGLDAEALLMALEDVVSSDEDRRRKESDKVFLASVTPKSVIPAKLKT